MPTLANDLVQFLMQLFGNREAIQEFLDNPERTLTEHGLGNVCSADVDAAMPVVLDYAPITVNAASFERDYNTGGSGAWGQAGASAGLVGSASAVRSASQGTAHGGDLDDHANAVQQLHHVVNHFSYTTNITMLDDREVITDQSVNQNIWAHGDVEQWFDNDAVAADDHAGEQGAHNTGHLTDIFADSSVPAGGGAGIGTGEPALSDSFNTDPGLDVVDSFNPTPDTSHYPDHPGSAAVNHDVRDLFNDDSDGPTHNPVQVEDSFNHGSSTFTADVQVEDHFQDNPATGLVEDNLVAGDTQLDFTEDNPIHADVVPDHHAVIDDAVVDDSGLL